MVANIKKYWEPGIVDLTATATAYKIVEIGAGQSVVIKNIGTAGSYIELFPEKGFATGKGFRLYAKETVTFSLPKSFGENNFLEIYAVPQTAGDDVNFIKIFDTFPILESSERLG